MVSIQNLHKKFGKNIVLSGVNLEIKEGGIFAVLGPNGSGKTTMIKSVLGMVIPDKFPPLAKADYLENRLASISAVIHGMSGENVINDKIYTATMPKPELNDKELVAVINYIFSSGGNEIQATSLNEVNAQILDPRDTYTDAKEWETKAKDLANRFVANFEQYTDNEEGKSLVKAGPSS